jgi:hypothetical protein
VAVDQVRTKLAQTPERLPWIRSSIENTTSALEEIGKWVDRGFVAQQPNVLDQAQKLRHILNDRERLADRKSELMACHQQLSNVLSFLNRLEDLPTGKELPTYQDTTYFDDIVSRHRRVTSQGHLGDGATNVALGKYTRYHAGGAFRPANRISSTPEAQGTSITDAVKSTLQSVNGQMQAMSYRSTSNHKPYKSGYRSPLSLPPSPPPTYASAGQRSPNSQAFHEDTKRHLNIDRLSLGGSRSSLSEPLYDVCIMPVAERDTRAYAWPKKDQALAELAGDSFMSGTNSDGPVNPYAFHPVTPIPAPRPDAFRTKRSEMLSELPGDVSLAIELPGSEPAHTPRHSIRSSWDMSSHGSPANPTYSFGYPTSVSELPAIPSRRPVMPHATSGPIAASHELSSAPPIFELGLASSLSHTSLGAASQLSSARPCSVSSISSSPPPPTSSTVSLHTSLCGALTASQASPAHEQPKWPTTPQPAVNTSSARMRRQKHMLDLLDSIDR